MSGEKFFLVIAIVFMIIVAVSCNDQKVIYVKLDSGYHISEDMDVSINGLKVGEVKSINLLPDRTVLAEINIDEKIKIPKDVMIYTKTVDLLGNNELSIEGGTTNDYLVSGDTVIYSGVSSITSDSSAIDEISDLVNSLFGNNQKDSILKELRLLNLRLDSLLEKE